ncbi:MAG: YwaF family protein [Clostridia bacterium]|nr:YwaF family protein [Clostridia bacterium]
MSFIEWLYSSYPNPHVDGQYGLLHILTMLFIVAFIVVSSILLRNKSDKTKRIVLFVLVSIILILGVTRRIVNLCKTTDYTVNNILSILLPRPGCAISCWLVIAATIINKKFFYNFSSIIAILCGVIFFAYPEAGFNNQYLLFENIYSIFTHTLFLISGVCFITYGFTDFKYKNAWKELICLGVLLVYVLLEIYVLKIEGDPFYFMPQNDVQDIVGLGYGIYLPGYLAFIAVYLNAYYLIPFFKNKISNKSSNKKKTKKA